MSPREGGDLAWISDILEAAAAIINGTNGLRLTEFIGLPQLTYAGILLKLQIIGEASKNLTAKTKTKYPDIKWSNLAKLRDFIAHHYWRADHVLIWNLIQKELPTLIDKLQIPDE